jgi:hypothetical protein
LLPGDSNAGANGVDDEKVPSPYMERGFRGEVPTVTNNVARLPEKPEFASIVPMLGRLNANLSPQPPLRFPERGLRLEALHTVRRSKQGISSFT